MWAERSLPFSCLSSSSWQGLFDFDVGGGGVGEAGVNVSGSVPGDGFVRADVERFEGEGPEGSAVVGHDRRDGLNLACFGVRGRITDERVAQEQLGLGEGFLDGGDGVEHVRGR